MALRQFYLGGQSTTLEQPQRFLVADTQVELFSVTGFPGELGYAIDTARMFVRTGFFGTWTGPQGPKQTEIDFGATPVSEATFTIIDASVVASSIIVGSVANIAPTGKDLDELEMDELSLAFGAGAGSFTIFARGLNGYVADKFKINYNVG